MFLYTNPLSLIICKIKIFSIISFSSILKEKLIVPTFINKFSSILSKGNELISINIFLSFISILEEEIFTSSFKYTISKIILISTFILFIFSYSFGIKKEKETLSHNKDNFGFISTSSSG